MLCLVISINRSTTLQSRGDWSGVRSSASRWSFSSSADVSATSTCTEGRRLASKQEQGFWRRRTKYVKYYNNDCRCRHHHHHHHPNHIKHYHHDFHQSHHRSGLKRFQLNEICDGSPAHEGSIVYLSDSFIHIFMYPHLQLVFFKWTQCQPNNATFFYPFFVCS